MKWCIENVSRREFLEWWAEYLLEPWGDDWQQASTIAAEIANSHGGHPVRLDHYIPRKIGPKPSGPSIEDQIAILDSFVKDKNRETT